MRFRSASPFLLIVFILAQPSLAQITRVASDQSRGKFYDGILRTLVDSQSNWQQQNVEPKARGAQSQLVGPARNKLTSFANEAGELITALRYEERYSLHARGLLGEAIRVKAVADVLLGRITGYITDEQLKSEFSELDRQWHLLSHQIQQTADLSDTVMRRVQRLDQINAELESQLQLHPQMDTQGLTYYFSALGENLNNLAQDVRIDLFSHPKKDQFATGLQQLRTKAERLRLAVENDYRYQDVAEYYKNFHAEWLTTKNELRSADDRYIQRNINRITQLHNKVHELLWLPPVIDGRDILYQADQLIAQVAATAEDISMRDLLDQPNARDLFRKAAEFNGLCKDFRNTVATETQLDNLRWDFKTMEVAWEDIKGSLNPLERQDTIQNISAIEALVGQLRHDLGLHDAVNWNEAIEMASMLTNMSDLLYYDINRIIGRNTQFPAQFRNQVSRQADQFHKSAEQFHGYLVRHNSSPEVKNLARQMAQQWNELQATLAKIPYDQRFELARTSQEIGPSMAKLQVMYAY